VFSPNEGQLIRSRESRVRQLRQDFPQSFQTNADNKPKIGHDSFLLNPFHSVVQNHVHISSEVTSSPQVIKRS